MSTGKSAISGDALPGLFASAFEFLVDPDAASCSRCYASARDSVPQHLRNHASGLTSGRLIIDGRTLKRHGKLGSCLDRPQLMIATVIVLMIAHLAEVLVWSLIYAVVGAAPAGTDLVYFAFVNYTTLGYGDVTPVERWRLLGPMTAMNGVLLFGWSTAVIFEVLRMTLLERGDGDEAGKRVKRWRPE